MAAPMKRSFSGVSQFFRSIQQFQFSYYTRSSECKNTDKIYHQVRNYCLENGHSVARYCSSTTGIIRPSVGTHGQAQRLPYRQRASWDFPTMVIRRWIATGLSDEMLRKEMDKLTDRFMEAKELLDDARESMGSVYFNEDLTDADEAVAETLKEYRALLSSLSEEQRQNVTRTIGLRMEELSAQQAMIQDMLKD